VGALFNLLDTEQVLTVHVMFLPLAVALAVGLHLLLVRLRGVCPPIDGETSEEVTP
jgi:quinol-cytochrome oxidoreductase complex cytochrome b subunit